MKNKEELATEFHRRTQKKVAKKYNFLDKDKTSRPVGQASLLVMLVAIFFISLCFAVLAETIKTKTVTYNFSAKETTIANKTGIITLKGKAEVIKNGDHLNADQITIYKDVQTGEIIKMEAVGNVDMSEEGKKSTCKKVIFYESEDRIEFEGSEESPAVVDDGKNKLVAPNITYFRKEDRLEAKAEKGTVTGQVIIEEKETEAQGEPAQEKK